MSKSEDYPSRLTEKEIFLIFDTIENHGYPQEAREAIRKKLHPVQLPHRTTVAAVFNVGVELFKRGPNAPNVLTNEEVDEVIEKAGYGVSSSKVKELHRLYQLWKIHGREEADELDVTAILSTLGPERWRKTWFLRKLVGLDEKTTAEKLKTTVESVTYDIEIGGKEFERSKTKGETKRGQIQHRLNLPPWVNQAQTEHLEGREQRGDLGGMEIITYPGGIGIRQQLELFKGCFPDIDPRSQSLCHPLDDEIVMAQLRGHLPDEAFWSRAKDFWEKARKCDTLLDAAYERFTSVGEELAPLKPSRGPEPDAYTTSGWARRVLVRALSKELGFKEPREYHHQKLPNGGFMLEDDGLIYVGPDDVAPEQKHRELVDDFRQTTEEFNLIVSLMKDLQNLRQKIIARIDQCLRKKEYSFNYCPDCPAEQARKLLLADK